MPPLPSSSKTSKSTSKAAASAVGNNLVKKKKQTNKRESFNIYIYKVLQETHPDASISCKSMSIINSFLNDILERVATEAGRLVQRGEKRTITSHDIQTAVRLVLPSELGKHAISEGSKAVSTYNCSEV